MPSGSNFLKGSKLNKVNIKGREQGSLFRRNRTTVKVNVNLSQVQDKRDLQFLRDVAVLADSTAGVTAPHPNAGCMLVDSLGNVVGRGVQRAQGTTSPEVLAVQDARSNGALSLSDCTAYLNLESGDCHGDDAAIQALIESKVSRVCIGLLHPLNHLRGHALREFSKAGIEVQLLTPSDDLDISRTRKMCLEVNDGLLHRGALGRPMSILKYAMTLDGKIATTTGHSAWVSGTNSRARVFEGRARAHAVIVGGNTLRRDNPRLTTRREGGHAPTRIVMSRTMDLRADANLWDISVAPTIVMTQKGARTSFQSELRDRGVEVVEFDFLTPDNVAQYLHYRGYLRCFWECGGTLASPAISGGTIHKVMAFVAPKIIGGEKAPSPVGDLGFVEMTQSLHLSDIVWEQIDEDLLIQGYLPSSGGLEKLEEAIETETAYRVHPTKLGVLSPRSIPTSSKDMQTKKLMESRGQGYPQQIEFFQVWDKWGALSNFSPHPVRVTKSTVNHAFPDNVWQSVEHYYQSMKFAGNHNKESQQVAYQIAQANSPEEATKIGRQMQRERPDLLTSQFLDLRLKIMKEGLIAKFQQHEGPRQLLLQTRDSELVESSPRDYFWGCGIDGVGENNLGKLLMLIRDQLVRMNDNGNNNSLQDGQFNMYDFDVLLDENTQKNGVYSHFY